MRTKKKKSTSKAQTFHSKFSKSTTLKSKQTTTKIHPTQLEMHWMQFF